MKMPITLQPDTSTHVRVDNFGGYYSGAWECRACGVTGRSSRVFTSPARAVEAIADVFEAADHRCTEMLATVS